MSTLELFGLLCGWRTIRNTLLADDGYTLSFCFRKCWGDSAGCNIGVFLRLAKFVDFQFPGI